MKSEVQIKTRAADQEQLWYGAGILLFWILLSSLTHSTARAAKPEGFDLLPDPMDSIQIIGGVNVSSKEAVSQSIVAVYDVSVGGLCTGSVLQSRLVLTAAHCVTDEMGNNSNPTNLRVITGTNLKAPSTKVLGVERVVVFPAWKERADQEFNTGDLALVKLSAPLPASFHSATVLSSASLLKKGSRVRLAGYGISNGVTHVGSGVLREVDVSVANPAFSETEVLMDQRFGKGACHGDSGGPAYLVSGARLLLFGITSRGVKDQNDDCSQFSAYTNMVAYRAWLSQTASGLTGSSTLGADF